MSVDSEVRRPHSRLRKIGLVGGVSWRSTLAYYSGICTRFERLKLLGELSSPEIAIESLDLHKAVSYLGTEGDEDSWQRFDAYHRDALLRLQAGGAEVAAIASNTPHHRFDSIVRGAAMPVINVFDVTARECARRRITSILLLGTRTTMFSDVVRAKFSAQGVDARGPGEANFVSDCVRFIEMLQWGESSTLGQPLAALAAAAYEQWFDGEPTVCLSCSELPLAFPRHSHRGVFHSNGVRFINSTALHIDALVEAI